MSLIDFFAGRPFPPDPFQEQAAKALEAGHSVVVTAPTGAGKTLVAEAAIHLAVEAGRRAFYTTPIKALSNQKFGDLVAEHGSGSVGLLTGDNVVNGDAQIVVMTTEVLRNMIYADRRALDDVAFVILDEVHYLQDPLRGAVWEEVLIHAPQTVRFVCLSATIANADEFATWVRERRGPTELIVAEERPVPLEGLYMMADRFGPEHLLLLPTFVRQEGRLRPNPRIERLLAAGGRRRFATPRRLEVVERLAADGLLPVIYFIFSRAGCDAAALRILESGIRLTTPEQRERAREVAEARTAHLDDDDLTSLGYGRWLATLQAGAAAHHAGLIPAFKEAVEELFASGDLPVVFATETLALGINMPARTVVLESLSKFDGTSHQLLEPGDYTQLTGRAGRRGIDTVGYGIVLHSRFVPFDQVARIASVGSHPLRSSFRPTYNMAANLVANYPQSRAEEMLRASFAQFQRRNARRRAEQALEGLERRLEEELADALCEQGSVEEYAELRAARHPGREDLAAGLHPGDVIEVPQGPRAGRFVVLRRLGRGDREPRVLALSTSGKVHTLGPRELVPGTERVGVVDLPRPYRRKDRRLEQELLRRLRRIPRRPSPRRETGHIDHPVATCPDAEAHLGALRRARRTARRIEQLRAELEASDGGLVAEFRKIERLLGDWGYLDGWALTDRGRRLRFVYNEADLLVAECVERGLASGLSAEELAALVSVFVYEPRKEGPEAAEPPTATLAERWRAVQEVWEELTADELSRRLPPTRRPEPGFMAAAYDWATGASLEELEAGSLAVGDFVRVTRQLADLLRQLRDAYPELAATARAALEAVDRGVVAAQGVG